MRSPRTSRPPPDIVIWTSPTSCVGDRRIGAFGRLDRVGALDPSIQGEPGAFADARVAGEKRRTVAGDAREHVAALGLLFDQQPVGEVVRVLERGEPDVAVALV